MSDDFDGADVEDDSTAWLEAGPAEVRERERLFAQEVLIHAGSVADTRSGKDVVSIFEFAQRPGAACESFAKAQFN